jgi:hypothetical protein
VSYAFRSEGTVVPASAPRIPQRLLEALVRLDDRSVSIAETYRRLGAEADRLGITRPSYERVRQLVHELRRIRRGPTTTQVLMDVAWRSRAPEEFLDHVAGIGVRRLS